MNHPYFTLSEFVSQARKLFYFQKYLRVGTAFHINTDSVDIFVSIRFSVIVK